MQPWMMAAILPLAIGFEGKSDYFQKQKIATIEAKYYYTFSHFHIQHIKDTIDKNCNVFASLISHINKLGC